jgi:HlyD family secretion protein
MMKKRIAAAAIIAALGALAWILYPRVFAPNGIGDSLIVSGNIEAHESVVSFKAVQSRVDELPFNEGQWVAAGTTLARLDDTDYGQQVAIDQAQVNVFDRQLDSSRQRVEAAHAVVESAQADLEQRRLDFARARSLFADKVISTQERDHAQTALKQAQAALDRDNAYARLAANDVAVASADLRRARESLAMARITRDYTVLRAPFSGVIITRNAELGEVMQPGTPVVTMADLDHVWLRAYIAETDLGRIRWGQPAAIRTDTYPGRTYPGRISFIASKAEFTPKNVETHKERVTLVYRIKIDVDNPAHELKPGMPADATIDLTPPVTHPADTAVMPHQ